MKRCLLLLISFWICSVCFAGQRVTGLLRVDGNVGINTTNTNVGLQVGNGTPSWTVAMVNTTDAYVVGDVEIDGALYVDGFLYGNGSKLTGITGVISGLTQNSITKSNAAGTGLIDSAIYDVNGNVGIGTTVPLAGLELGNAGTPTYPAIASSNDAYFHGDVEIDGILYVDSLIYANNILMPYGSFSSADNQVVGATTIAYATTLDTTDIAQNIYCDTAAQDSKIYIWEAGTYLITFSAVAKSVNTGKMLDIWLAVNGVNVPSTNTITKFVGVSSEKVITVTYIYKFTAGQYFELKYRGDDTQVQMVATAAASSPTRPACPSMIVTVNKISR